MGALLAVGAGVQRRTRLDHRALQPPRCNGPAHRAGRQGVTFDTGGISIKPAGRMHEMKFDMTGGAVVLGHCARSSELGLPLDLVVVVGSTENMPAGNAYKPGDIISAADGTTIEITNTDAEGRLVLADCLLHARDEGAEVLRGRRHADRSGRRGVGSTYAGLISTDDELSGELLAAAPAPGNSPGACRCTRNTPSS